MFINSYLIVVLTKDIKKKVILQLLLKYISKFIFKNKKPLYHKIRNFYKKIIL